MEGRHRPNPSRTMFLMNTQNAALYMKYDEPVAKVFTV